MSRLANAIHSDQGFPKRSETNLTKSHVAIGRQSPIHVYCPS